MTQRLKFLLGLLALVVAGAAFYEWHGSDLGAPAVEPSAGAPYTVLSVENPALRLDELDRVRKLEYTGIHRNIFSPTPPPPPVPPPTPEEVKRNNEELRNQPPPPPPPIVVPATFFGYVTDARTGHKEAFFSDADDVYIAAEGETLLGRFRVLKIGNDSVEVEEIASGRRTTLTLQEPEPAG
ncbi:MAG TPA: hypothetical protein VEH50_07315 [Methylomirabilota bacterium]|jgi:hypothetical protein|nr:hypothetical protein [Methylomirabilota bacterium]